MAHGPPLSRRRLLGLLGTAGSVSLAGCNQQEPVESSATPTSSLTDTEAEELQTNTDEEKPAFGRFGVEPTTNAGEVQYGIQVSDNGGLAEVAIQSADESTVHTFDGTRTGEIEGALAATPGVWNTVTATVEDRSGNEADERRESYARKYGAQANPAFDLGAIYRPGIGGDTWENCLAGTPAVGGYEEPPGRQTATQHLDQLQGCGINRLVVPADHANDIDQAKAVWNSALAEDTIIEVAYFPRLAALKDRETFTEHVQGIRDRIAAIPNYNMVDGRPVVTVGNLMTYRDGWMVRPAIEETFDTPADFVSVLREVFRGADGTASYLISDLVGFDPFYKQQISERLTAFAASFDGLLNVLYHPPEGRGSWADALSEIGDVYAGGRRFAEEHDIEFIPVVYPGFDRSIDTCSEASEWLPRDPDRFLELLELAQIYATTGRIRLDSFNDWADGTQIEPGAVRGEFYGDAYLDTVKRFQSSTEGLDQRQARATYYIDPDGSDSNPGSMEEPLATIQQAIYRAGPGDTIHVQAGTYTRPVQTIRAGTPDEPITITGPPAAVFNADGPLEINHSHVHLRGLTFDGLVDPDNPDDAGSYSESLIIINRGVEVEVDGRERPPDTVTESDYLTDVVVKPHRIGNCRADFIKLQYANDVEIGGFEVIGPAGVKFTKGDAIGHNSEIVYLGIPPDKGYAPDESSNIHVHHIDNSGGYAHAELVDCKTGTHDVTIEYCTDGGGAGEAVSDGGGGRAIHLGGNDITVRLNVISNGEGAGIEIVSYPAAMADPHPAFADGGTDNAIYGNRLVDNAGRALRFAYPDQQGQDDQRAVCGNEYNGETDGEPDHACSSDVPAGNGIGHLGGDSPWD